MKRTVPSGTRHSGTIDTSELVSEAWRDVGTGLDRFRVMAGIDAVQGMMNEDAADLAGECCGWDAGRPGHRRGGHPARPASREAGSGSSDRGCAAGRPGGSCRCRAGRRSVMAAVPRSGPHRRC